MQTMFDRIEEVELQEPINKYYPGSATFRFKSGVIYGDRVKMPIQKQNVSNKNAVYNTKSVELSEVITLEVPKSILADYEKKIVPAGTIFLAAFVGHDNRLPVIIGMGADK